MGSQRRRFSETGLRRDRRRTCPRYFPDEFSPYREIKWNSQVHYDKSGKIIMATVGARQIGKLLGPDFLRWHANWGAPAGRG